jgi:hypothetical protein
MTTAGELARQKVKTSDKNLNLEIKTALQHQTLGWTGIIYAISPTVSLYAIQLEYEVSAENPDVQRLNSFHMVFHIIFRVAFQI